MNVDFNFTKELMYDVEKHLYDNPDTRRLVDELNMPNDKTFGIFIENGDWKHEHLWLDHLVSDYLNSRGIEFDSFTKHVGTSDSDCYTAWHYFHILGEAEPMLYDVEGDDELAASKAQEVANTLKYPVSCRGTVYKPNLTENLTESSIWAYQTIIDRQPGEKLPSKTLLYGNNFVMSRSPYRRERISSDWKRHISKIIEWSYTNYPGLFRTTHDYRLNNFNDPNSEDAFVGAIEDLIENGHILLEESLLDCDITKNSRKKKQPCDSITKDAGNVEHNIEMFNKMNSPVEGPCTNPVSGPMGEAFEGSDNWVLIKTDKWYDPEGLGIEPDDEVICSGTEDECREAFSDIVVDARKKDKLYREQAAKGHHRPFMMIEKLDKYSLIISYPNAQSKDVYQLINKDSSSNEELDDDILRNHGYRQDNLKPTFEIGDRVAHRWADEYNVGTIKDIRNQDGIQYQVEWDYSDGDYIEWLYGDEITHWVDVNEDLTEARDPYFTPYGYKDAAKVLNGKAPEYYYHLKEIEMDQGDGEKLARYARKLGLPVVQDPDDDPDYPTFYILGKYHWNDYFYPYPSAHEPTHEMNESYISRDQMIDELKRDGRGYNFNRFTDAQIYKMYQKYVANKPQIEDDNTDEYEFVVHAMCDRCGIRLNDGGTCPICDDGEEDYFDEDLDSSDYDSEIELYYPKLEFTAYGPQRDVDDWDERDVETDWSYYVDQVEVEEFLCDICQDDLPEDCPSYEDDYDAWNTYLNKFVHDNFDELFEKYKQKILDHWEDYATEDAQENYDFNEDGIDWDSMPGGHDDFDI